MNLSISAGGADNRRAAPPRRITPAKVEAWILNKGLDKATTDALLEKAARVPDAALGHFARKFQHFLARTIQEIQERAEVAESERAQTESAAATERRYEDVESFDGT